MNHSLGMISDVMSYVLIAYALCNGPYWHCRMLHGEIDVTCPHKLSAPSVFCLRACHLLDDHILDVE